MDLVRVVANPINEVHRPSGSCPPGHTACHDEEEDEGRDNEALGEDGCTSHAPSGRVGMSLDLEYAVNRPRLKYAAAAF